MTDNPLLTPKQSGLLTAMLKQARKALDLEMGIVSHIRGDKYHVMAINAEHNTIVPGEIFALADTICHEVINTRQPLSICGSGNPEISRLHPIYAAMKLEAYIATPIWLNGEIWGTVNFTSTAKRQQSFTTEQQAEVDGYAEQVSQLLGPTPS